MYFERIFIFLIVEDHNVIPSHIPEAASFFFKNRQTYCDFRDGLCQFFLSKYRIDHILNIIVHLGPGVCLVTHFVVDVHEK